MDQAKTVLADYCNSLNLRNEAEQWRELQETMRRLQAENAQLKVIISKSLEAARILYGPDPFADVAVKALRIQMYKSHQADRIGGSNLVGRSRQLLAV